MNKIALLGFLVLSADTMSLVASAGSYHTVIVQVDLDCRRLGLGCSAVGLVGIAVDISLPITFPIIKYNFQCKHLITHWITIRKLSQLNEKNIFDKKGRIFLKFTKKYIPIG